MYKLRFKSIDLTLTRKGVYIPYVLPIVLTPSQWRHMFNQFHNDKDLNSLLENN